jgi:hypothetical protein
MVWLLNTRSTQVGSGPHPAAPFQPLNVDPDAGVARSVSTVGLGMKLPDGEGKLAAHIIPQSSAAGLLATVPVPVPVFVISIKLQPGATSNLALMLRSSVIVTVQGPDPLHPPPVQPLKSAPALYRQPRPRKFRWGMVPHSQCRS